MKETKATRMSTYRFRIKFSLARITGILILVIGTICLILSTVADSAISAMIGLGLVFWGTIVLFVHTEEYVKARALDATTLSILPALEQTLSKLKCRGRAIYLPPKYFRGRETVNIYVSKNRVVAPPTLKRIRKLEQLPETETFTGILLTPPGLELMKLFETTLGKSFAETDLTSLQQEMPKLIVEELEIASDFEMRTEPSVPTDSAASLKRKGQSKSVMVQIKMERIRGPIHVEEVASIDKGTSEEAARFLTNSFNIGCPLTSAFACAIAKSSGKTTTLENEEISTDAKILRATYRIH